MAKCLLPCSLIRCSTSCETPPDPSTTTSDIPGIFIPIETLGRVAHRAKKSFRSTEEKKVANEDEMIIRPSIFWSFAKWYARFEEASDAIGDPSREPRNEMVPYPRSFATRSIACHTVDWYPSSSDAVNMPMQRFSCPMQYLPLKLPLHPASQMRRRA